MTFLDACRKTTSAIWDAYEHHPWIEALAAGELPPEKFAWFQLDDGPHVAEFNRTLALGIAKAPTGHPWASAAAHVLDDCSTVGELEEKRALVAELGYRAPSSADRWTCSPAREAYVNHLVRAGFEGTLPDIASTVLPCAMFVEVIGARFRGVRLRGPAAYQRWADMYTRRTRSEMCHQHIAVIEAHAAHTDEESRERLLRQYTRSLQHQVRVFDAAWTMAGTWPGGHDAYATRVVSDGKEEAAG